MVAAPLTPEELLARADLAGYARVLSKEAGVFAHLRFTKLLKGRPPQTGFLGFFGLKRDAKVRLRGTSMMLGEWSDAGGYVPGERVRTHLCWNARDEVYETLWWNAVDRVRRPT